MSRIKQSQHDGVSVIKKFLTFTLEEIEMKPTKLQAKLQRKNKQTTLTIGVLTSRLFRHSSGLELDAIQLEEIADILDLKLCLIPKHLNDPVKEKWKDIFKLTKVRKQLDLVTVNIPGRLSKIQFTDKDAFRKFFEYREIKFGQAIRLMLLKNIAEGKTILTAQQYSALIKICELCGDFKKEELPKEPKNDNGRTETPERKNESQYILEQQPRLSSKEVAPVESGLAESS